MHVSGGRATLRRTLTVLAAAALLGPAASPRLHGTASQTPATETRALWVLRSSLASPDSIATLIRTARDHGFNTLLVQVRGRGDAYFNDGIEPRAAELSRQPAAFDPLATVLASGHAAGLRVHAWMNVNLISSAADLPIAATHIIHRHPEWLMVPRELAQELSRVKEESPGYVGKIARWTRAQATVEGLYASPVVPAAVEHVSAVARDLVTSTTLVTRRIASTTAAPPFASSVIPSARRSGRSSSGISMRVKVSIRFSIRTRFRPNGRRSGSHA
jgi:hypothetical protein